MASGVPNYLTTDTERGRFGLSIEPGDDTINITNGTFIDQSLTDANFIF